MIPIDSIWLAIEPMDMRAGTETALARVVAVFGAAKPHCAYLFANRRAKRIKVLVHDGVGIWLAARRLNKGRFFWPSVRHGSEVELDAEQLQAFVLGLPWQRVGSGGARHHFDYHRLRADVQIVSAGIQQYLSPQRALPRDDVAIKGDYRDQALAEQ